MKRALIFFLIVVALVFVCACSKNSEAQTVTVTVTYTAQQGGEISGEATQSKTVNEGENAEFTSVTAVAYAGYYFTGWSDGVTDSTRQDTLSQSTEITAQFQAYEYATLEYLATQGGGILGSDYQRHVKGSYGTQVQAFAMSGYKFVGWSDGVTSDTRTDLANTDKVITAIFEELQYVNITYTATQGGTVSGALNQSIPLNQSTSEVTAVPEQGYKFICWSDGNENPTRSDIATGEITYTAIFSTGLKVTYVALEGGSIVGAAEQSVEYKQQTSEVTANPKSGYRFVCWSDGSTSPTRTDVAGFYDATYTATFVKVCRIKFDCGTGQGTIQGNALQTVDQGERTEQVTAVPSNGYEFICWSNGSKSPTITVKAEKNTTYTAYFSRKGSGLPVITINTTTGLDITSKTEYVTCTVTVLDTEQGIYSFAQESAQIRGRGNSTWNQAKKPYKIKFDSKQDLFGFGKAKDWVLLADYIDRSLLRNNLAFSVAGQLEGLECAPDCQSVEVYVNGEYRGVYLLCEQVEAGSNRVEISEDASVVDTGYLLEMDGWKDGVYVTVGDKLNGGRAYVIKSPGEDEITNDHKNFIKNYLTQCISAAQGSDYEKVKELIDVESFAQAYIVLELFKCPDVDYSSLYFYKQAGGKLYFGPVWDFDMSASNVTHKLNATKVNYNYLLVKEICPWFKALLNYSEFRELVGNTLAEYKNVIEQTIASELEYAYSKHEAFDKNFTDAWQILGASIWTNPAQFNAMQSWSEHVEYLKTYLANSLEFLLEAYPPSAE